MAAEAAGPGLRRSGASVFQRLRGKAVRRIGWGVADQAVSSLTNFAVSIYVVRNLGAVQFGAFSLAYVTYGFALCASRGLSTDPLMVRFSGTDVSTWRRAVASCTGAAVICGLAMGACALVAAVLIGGTAGAAFLALGLTLPVLMLQDSWRYSFFALGRGGQAFLNDTIWAVVMLPALLGLRMSGHATVFWFVFAWGAAAGVAAAVGPLQARVMPRLSGAWTWLVQHRDLGPRYLLEGTSNSAANQLRTYGVGLILGLATLGAVQASVTLMGPMTILFLGMGLVLIPEGARVLQRAPQRLTLFCVLVSAGLSAAAVGWGVALLITVPRGLGAAVIGPTWRPTYPLLLPMMLFVVAQGAAAGSAAGMHALGSAKRSLNVAFAASGLLVAFSIAGAVWDGAVGSIYGMAAAAWIATVLAWWQLIAAVRESDRIPSRHGGRHATPRPLDDEIAGEPG
jgi:O-antigen/teichoic acid export membrane protein